MRPHPLLSAAPVAAVLVLTLSACSGGSDGDDEPAPTTVAQVDGDLAACRTLGLLDASLEALRTTVDRGGSSEAVAGVYTDAIGRATTAVGTTEVSQELLDATTDLVGAWSRTRSYVLARVDADLSVGDGAPVLDAEVRLFRAVTDVCVTD